MKAENTTEMDNKFSNVKENVATVDNKKEREEELRNGRDTYCRNE